MSVSQEHHSLKRDHDSFDFDDLTDLEQPFSVPPELAATYATQPQKPRDVEMDSGESSMPTPPVSVGNNKREASPTRSRSTSLTDPGSATPSLRGNSPMPTFEMPSLGQQRGDGSPLPSAFAALNGSAPPPAKKAKLSYAEKEMKRIQKEIKDQERAEEKARKERERQAHAEEKARRDAEKEAEKKRKEVERVQKEAEKKRKEIEREQKEAEKKKKEAEREQKRAAQEAEKAAKEEKKRRKEEEKQRAEEEKRKKERSQMSLGAFFTIPAVTATRRNSLDDRRSESPAPATLNPSLAAAAASPAAMTPTKPSKSDLMPYEKIFSDFFIKPDVTMAPINRFERDEEASESLECTIDSYILGNRSPGCQRKFDPMELFHLSSHNDVLRGKRYVSVREIMTEMSGKASRPIDLTTDSQNTQIKRANDLLRKVPLKFLKFEEDVRPPYRGTYTCRPVNGMAKLARNPLRKDLPDTNYDYDSEAEWIEDEDAEDLNSEGDEDEDLGEDGEDMEGFLDDENDEIANSRRLVLLGELEPISSGLCWEDCKKRNTNVKMMPYRMEIIIDHTLKAIDPFSTQYWEPTLSAIATMDPPRLPLNTLKSNSLTVNGFATKPIKPFFASASDLLKLNPAQQLSQPQLSTHPTAIPLSTHISSTAPSPAVNSKPKKLVSAEDMPAFKQEIAGSNLSKVGLIEVLKKKFPGRSGAAIKSTLELVAKRVGAKEADKRWVIVDEGGA